MDAHYDLAGRTAIVTGGAGGLGRGIARALRDAGAAVELWDADPEGLAEAAVELDLGLPVRICVHETVEQNAGHYYDQIKKFKRKRTGAKAAMEREIQRPVARASGYSKPKNRWYHRFRWFQTSDGILVIGGFVVP